MFVFTYENAMASLRFKPCLICHQSNEHDEHMEDLDEEGYEEV